MVSFAFSPMEMGAVLGEVFYTLNYREGREFVLVVTDGAVLSSERKISRKPCFLILPSVPDVVVSPCSSSFLPPPVHVCRSTLARRGPPNLGTMSGLVACHNHQHTTMPFTAHLSS